MPRKTETHLGAARRHGRKALGELRRMTADSALYWVLAHRSRVAQFKRSIAGTRAEVPFKRLLEAIRVEASTLKRPAPRRRKATRVRRRQRARRALPLPPFMFG